MISLFKFLMGTNCRVATFCPLLRLVWTSFFLPYPKFSTYVRTSALFGFRKKKNPQLSLLCLGFLWGTISVVEKKKSYLNSRSLTWCDNFGHSVKRFFFFPSFIFWEHKGKRFPREGCIPLYHQGWEEEWGCGGFTLTCSGAWFRVECTVSCSRSSAFISQHALKFLGLRYAK